MATTQMRDARTIRLKTTRGALTLMLLLLVQFLDFLDAAAANRRPGKSSDAAGAAT